MFKSYSAIGLAVILPLALGSFAGCKKVQELTDEQIAEAVANQMVSSYHAMSVELSATGSNGNTVNVSITCSDSGTVSWESFEEDGNICYRSTSSDCGFTVGGKSFTLSSDYEVCGFPPAVDNSGDVAEVTDLDGKTLYINGDVTVETANLAPRTCSYDMDLTFANVTKTADTFTMTTDFSGDLCKRSFDQSISLSVATDFEVEGD